jgi:hypothetical protein
MITVLWYYGNIIKALFYCDHVIMLTVLCYHESSSLRIWSKFSPSKGWVFKPIFLKLEKMVKKSLTM